MNEYFLKLKSLGRKVNFKLYLSNFVTKADFKNATDTDTTDFAKKTDLASLKSDVDKLDIDKLKNVQDNLINLKSKVAKLNFEKLETTPFDLTKLSNVGKNDIAKKTDYDDILVKNVKAIKTTDTINLIAKKWLWHKY